MDQDAVQAIHEPFIRQCYDLAVQAARKGNHPFGALLVRRGEVILTAENTVHTDDDHTRHAEMNLLTAARRRFSRAAIRESTLYTSTAPCMTCAAAIWEQDIGRVVFGVSYAAFHKLLGQEMQGIPGNEIYRLTGKPLVWIGPVLEAAGLAAYRHWPEGDPHRRHFLRETGS